MSKYTERLEVKLSEEQSNKINKVAGKFENNRSQATRHIIDAYVDYDITKDIYNV